MCATGFFHSRLALSSQSWPTGPYTEMTLYLMPKINFLVVRDEYLGWIHEKNEIDYYGVTFDINASPDECFPEVLQINMVEIEADNGEYANEFYPFTVDPAEFVGKKILAVPGCCQNRKGSTDRRRVNGLVAERDAIRQGMDREMMMRLLIGHGVYSTKIPEKRIDVVPRPTTTQVPKE